MDNPGMGVFWLNNIKPQNIFLQIAHTCQLVDAHDLQPKNIVTGV